MNPATRPRPRLFAVLLLAAAGGLLILGGAWHANTWVRTWAVGRTPAQRVAAELAMYAQEKKPLGRRGPHFEQALVALGMYKLPWSEAEVVGKLGTPDGMYRTAWGDLLLYKYDVATPGDCIAMVELVNGTLASVGFNTGSEIGQVTWAPYEPAQRPPPSQPEASATSQPTGPNPALRGG